MQIAALRALEFDRIREALATRALTPLGRERARTLEPATDPDEVQAGLDLTAEAVAFTRDGGSLAITGPEDLDAILAVLGVEDQPLDPLALLGLARLLRSITAVAGSVRRTAGPLMAAVAARAAAFLDETYAVERAIEPTGDVSDGASPALRETRDALRRQRARLRSSLDSLARGRDTAKYLQDQIVTDRNGRYVLVVRAEHQHAIPGIVHGSSASGASLYLEPLATVALNNEVVSLAERERAEVHRILRALTQAFRVREADLATTFGTAAVLDELHAKADLARRMDAAAPALATDGSVTWRGARHPLLIPAIRELVTAGPAARTAAQPVASDLVIAPPTRALVISGPNTGGKTVALKAFGLLAVMAQAGLLVPVDDGSAFTPFRSVFADIGDDQSIAASLSTFSAHIAHVVAMERALELPALVLLDELGGGTDPIEGGALGAAVIDHFRRRGATVVATTHDDALKSYAATTDGVRSAGFGFDPDTYAPTYRLIDGAPGRSLALEIAERLGLPADVIADAKARRSGRESQLAAHLARLDEELAAVTREERRLDADRRGLADERARLLEREARLTEREAVLRRRLDDRLNEKLRQARAEVDQIVGRLKQKADALARQAEDRATRGPGLSTGELGGLRSEARAALGAVGQALEPAETTGEAAPLAAPPVAGQHVLIASLQADGIVRSVSGKRVEVDVRGKRLRTSLSDLRARVTESDAGGHSPRPSAGHVLVTTAPREAGATRDLVLVGATVDEALARAGKFLDDALLADEHRLRVVHGHGTGRLRDALTGYFREHPLVASVSVAPEREGGGAATIVELKE